MSLVVRCADSPLCCVSYLCCAASLALSDVQFSSWEIENAETPPIVVNASGNLSVKGRPTESVICGAVMLLLRRWATFQTVSSALALISWSKSVGPGTAVSNADWANW